MLAVYRSNGVKKIVPSLTARRKNIILNNSLTFFWTGAASRGPPALGIEATRCNARAGVPTLPSLRGAKATKQSSFHRASCAMDCFAKIGRAFARPVGSQ
jgi:hypothetical protein